MSEIKWDFEALRRVLQGEEGPVAKELGRTAVKVEREAIRLVPVDTGRLRSSITWEFGKDSEGIFVAIGSNVTYAPHIEFGTIYMSAQPYLRPAANRVLGGSL